MSDTSPQDPRFSAFVPLLLLALTLLCLSALQTYGLMQERDRLTELRTNQAASIEEAQIVREQLRSLAVGAADLAAAGNENAQRLIEELARRGITVTPSQAAR